MLRRWRQRRRLLLLSLSHQNNDIIRLIITIISVDPLSFFLFLTNLHSIIVTHTRLKFIRTAIHQSCKEARMNCRSRHRWRCFSNRIWFSYFTDIDVSFVRQAWLGRCFASVYCLRSLSLAGVPRVRRQGYIHYFLISDERKGKTWLKQAEQVSDKKTSSRFLLLLRISQRNISGWGQRKRKFSLLEETKASEQSSTREPS